MLRRKSTGRYASAIEPLEARRLLSGAARVIGYLPDYRYGGINQIDLSLMTHVNYFSITANGLQDDNGDGTIDGTVDGSLDTTQISLTNLDDAVSRVHALGETISITIGANDFDPVASNANYLSTFAGNISTFVSTHHLDGVDIDWEPAVPTSERADYGKLVDALYGKLHPSGLTLSTAVNPINNDLSGVNKSELDWVEVMAYDINLGADHASYQGAVDALTDWVSYGVPASKLVLGVPEYGRDTVSWNDTKTYSDILSTYKTEHGAYPDVSVDSVDGWYFNGADTMEEKGAYVRDNSFGGMAIWELGQEHYDSNGKYDQWSLLPAISSMMRPPSWLTTPSGSEYDYVAATHTLYATADTVTLSGNAFASDPSLALVVNSGATVTLGANQKLASVTVNGTGKFDVKTFGIAIDYTGTSPIGSWNGTNYSGLTGLLKSGRNGGSWNGSGIASSSSMTSHTIGVIESSPALLISGSTTRAWNGFTIDATTVLIRYTLAGDINLDGKVNADDYFLIDSGYSERQTGYGRGDLDYDGKVNGNDYFIIDSGFASQAPAAPLDVVRLTATPVAAAYASTVLDEVELRKRDELV